MEALIPLFALVSLGLLATRFGADSRPAIRSDEHRLATVGMVWDSTCRPTAPAAADPTSTLPAPDGPSIKQLVWEPTFAAPMYPTLQALDGARDPGLPAFATDPNATVLEHRARQLTDQHWSERVWLTGFIDQARFDAVCDALEHDRQALRRVDVVVVSEQRSRIAS